MSDRKNMYVGPQFISKLNAAIEQGPKECPLCHEDSVEIIGFNIIIEGQEPASRKRVEFDLVCNSCDKRLCGPQLYSQVGRTMNPSGMTMEQREQADALLEKDLVEA